MTRAPFFAGLAVALLLGFGVGHVLPQPQRAPVLGSSPAETKPVPVPVPEVDRSVLPPVPSPGFEAESAWLLKVAATPASGLPDLFAEIMERRNRDRYFDVIYLDPLFQRWADLDPSGGARTVATAGDAWMLAKFFTHWARVAPDAALSAIARWEPPDARPELRAAALAAVAEKSPATFLDHLAAGSAKDAYVFQSPAVQAALDGLVVRDPEAAKTLLATIPKDYRNFLVARIAAITAVTSPEAATAWARSLDGYEERDLAFKNVAIVLARTDLAAAVALADEMSRDEFPTRQIATELAAADHERAFEWTLSDAPDNSRANVLSDVFLQPLKCDPEALADLASRICAVGDDPSLGRHALNNLELSPRQIAPIADALTARWHEPGSHGALALVLDRWANRAPDAATDWIFEQPEVLESIFKGGDASPVTLLLEATADSATAWLRVFSHVSQLPAERRAAILDPLAGIFTKNHDPFATDGPIGSGTGNMGGLAGSPGIAGNAAIPALVRERIFADSAAVRMREDPAAGTAWMRSIAAPLERETAFRQGTHAWADFEPEAATAWAMALPDGRDRDAAAAGMADTLDGDPGSAWAWVASIEAPDLRQRTARELTESAWDSRLHEIAALLPTLPLPPAETADILARIAERSNSSGQ